MSFLYNIVIYPMLFILPAYVANAAPVIFGGGAPLDFRKKLFGKRIFGDNKTIRGLFCGVLAGIATASFESLFIINFFIAGILMVIGTHAGDLLGSFIKRRLGRAKGAQLPVVDQYLFLILALLFAYPFAQPFGIFPSLYGLVFIIALTGIMHVATNRIAYRLRIKKVPW